MAIYRTISQSFWTDSKVEDEFTPEDKYFYLYILTNPHTNLCGCYEISKKQIAYETGYNIATVERLLDRFANIHKVISYDHNTKEILIHKWSKYNWTRSDKFMKAVRKCIPYIKNKSFQQIVYNLANDGNNPVDKYPIDTDKYPMDTSVSVSVSESVSVTDSVSESEAKKLLDKAHAGWVNRKR